MGRGGGGKEKRCRERGGGREGSREIWRGRNCVTHDSTCIEILQYSKMQY